MDLNVSDLHESACNVCNYVWTSAPQDDHNNSVIRDAYAAERDRLRAEGGLLSGRELAQIRERFKLSQREAAALFGGGYNAFNKYESGEVLQSFAMDRLLRLVAAIGTPAVEFLKDVHKPHSFIVIPLNSSNVSSGEKNAEVKQVATTKEGAPLRVMASHGTSTGITATRIAAPISNHHLQTSVMAA